MNPLEAFRELVATLTDALSEARQAADLGSRLASWWAVASGGVKVG